MSFEHDPSAYMLLILGNQQHLLRSCLTTGDLDGDPQPLKRKALIDTPPYRYWRCSRLLGLQFVTVLTSAVYISSLFGGKATLSQAARSGLIVVILADSSASTLLEYLDDLVDGLRVTNHFMTASDNPFGSSALEVTAPVWDHPIRSTFLPSRMFLAYYAMKRNFNRKFRKCDDGGAFGESVRTAENRPPA